MKKIAIVGATYYQGGRFKIELEADSEKDLADALVAAGRRIRLQARGGNWRLDAVMRRRGLSDNALGRLMGMTWMCSYLWRTGERKPCGRSLALACEALKCTPAEIGFVPPKKGEPYAKAL